MIKIELNDEVPVETGFDRVSFIQGVADLKEMTEGSLEFTFVDEAAIQSINKNHLGRTYITDIISFNLGTPEDPEGDLYICIDHVKKNAQSYEKSFDEELKLVLVHGILHILDYRDYTDEEKKEMYAEQDRILGLL